jgi:hypothetical protein
VVSARKETLRAFCDRLSTLSVTRIPFEPDFHLGYAWITDFFRRRVVGTKKS